MVDRHGDVNVLGATGEEADLLDAAGVQEFYTDFLRSRMVSYRIRGNKRLDAVMKRLRPLLRRDTVALDVGCGIGLIAEFMAKIATSGRVVGCDLSRANAWYAGKTATRNNLEFHLLDITTDHEKVRERLGGRLADLIVLVDVIEHIPSPRHAELFRALASLLANDGVIFLSFPSKGYQRWLRENDPEGLQPIDEEIELEDLLGAVRPAELAVHRWDPVDVRTKGQYIHALIEHKPTYDKPAVRLPPDKDFFAATAAALTKLGRLTLRPWRYYRYVMKPFRDRTKDAF